MSQLLSLLSDQDSALSLVKNKTKKNAAVPGRRGGFDQLLATTGRSQNSALQKKTAVAQDRRAEDVQRDVNQADVLRQEKIQENINANRRTEESLDHAQQAKQHAADRLQRDRAENNKNDALQHDAALKKSRQAVALDEKRSDEEAQAAISPDAASSLDQDESKRMDKLASEKTASEKQTSEQQSDSIIEQVIATAVAAVAAVVPAVQDLQKNDAAASETSAVDAVGEGGNGDKKSEAALAAMLADAGGDDNADAEGKGKKVIEGALGKNGLGMGVLDKLGAQGDAATGGQASSNALQKNIPGVQNVKSTAQKAVELVQNEILAPSSRGTDGAASSSQNGNSIFSNHLSQAISGTSTLVSSTQAHVAKGAEQAVALTQVAVTLAKNISEGTNQFQIRLDPPELGKIDVDMTVNADGQVMARLIVERPETLDFLQRDSRNIEKALEQSGLKTDGGGLEFSLRQQSHSHSDHQKNEGQTPAILIENPHSASAEEEALAATNISYLHLKLRDKGLDLKV